MSRPIILALGVLIVVAASACAPQTVAPTTVKPVRKPIALGVTKPATPAPGGGFVTQPGQATPSPAPTGMPAAGAVPTPKPSATPDGPTMYVPTPGPATPMPSGYIPPIPEDQLPTPAPTPVPTATPLPTPTPVPTPTPALLDAVVLSNSIVGGPGALTGYVVEPIPEKAGEYRPVQGVTVVVSAIGDGAQKARLTNAGNGTYRLPDVALGEYYVRVEKSGYAADSAPTPVRIYPGYTSGHTVFLIVPSQPLM